MKKYFAFLIFALFFLQANGQYLIDITKIEDKEAIKNYSGDINVRDKSGATPLMWAIFYSDLELVKLLLSKGANPYLKGHIHLHDSYTIYGSCMAVAAGQNKLEIIQFLIEKLKIPVDDKELGTYGQEDGWTALQWAAYNGNNEIIKYLVKKKAKINALSIQDGNKTALHFAAENGHAETVKLLIKLKAKKNLETSYGSKALDLALNTTNKELIMYMLSVGCESSTYDSEKINEIIKKIENE
jgi:ankyrin repeat protein